MSNTVAQNHFAKMCGVSRQAIGKAVKAGKVILLSKKVNLDHRLTCEYYHGITGKNLKPEAAIDPKPPVKKPPVKKAPAKKKPPAKKPAVKNNQEIEEITAHVDDLLPDNGNGFELPPGINGIDDVNENNLHLLPIDFIKKVKEFEVAMKARQMREESRGSLIKRDTVRQVFSKLYTVDTNQLKTLEDRLVPELCGVFGFQDGCPESFQARKMISQEMTKTLRFIKRLMDDFLIKHNESKLDGVEK